MSQNNLSETKTFFMQVKEWKRPFRKWSKKGDTLEGAGNVWLLTLMSCWPPRGPLALRDFQLPPAQRGRLVLAKAVFSATVSSFRTYFRGSCPARKVRPRGHWEVMLVWSIDYYQPFVKGWLSSIIPIDVHSYVKCVKIVSQDSNSSSTYVFFWVNHSPFLLFLPWSNTPNGFGCWHCSLNRRSACEKALTSRMSNNMCFLSPLHPPSLHASLRPLTAVCIWSRYFPTIHLTLPTVDVNQTSVAIKNKYKFEAYIKL